MAHLEMTGPHEKSSALKDLLLVLADRAHSGGDWPRIFLVLCALAVPGDVAVMIEDPQPPDLNQLHALAFDYTAMVVTRGMRHSSAGSIWLDLDARAFKLRGEAKETKLGPLFLDVIADAGGPTPQVYANVDLTAQVEQQCVAYDYPQMQSNLSEQLRALANESLAFYAISESQDEDCAIFVAPLARGRWIHLCMDLEADNSQAILRSEIHTGGQVIRSTDIQHWLPTEDVLVAMTPSPKWGCAQDPGAGQLAHLGLNQVHKRSIQLQDALFAIQELSPGFAILEVLGLTGDVAIMVQEPEVPPLWLSLPAVSFGYTLSEYANHGTRFRNVAANGTYAADLRHGHSRMTLQDGSTRIWLAFEYNSLAVRIQESENATPVCLTLPIDAADSASGEPAAQPLAATGIFDGVEFVNDEECNRFTFEGVGATSESVELWFSQETDSVCRISMRPSGGDEGVSGDGFWGVLSVRGWEPTYHPAEVFSESDATGEGVPDSWHCSPSNVQGSGPVGSWLSLSLTPPPEEMPAAAVLAKLSEAMGTVGLMSPHGARWLSRLVVLPPSRAPPPPPPRLKLLDPEMNAFAFSFTSMHPLQAQQMDPSLTSIMSSSPRSRSSGQVCVDLINRRLSMTSTATNVSAGISVLETRIIFRGDRERLYTHAKLNNGFEQCWSVNTAIAFPAQPAGSTANPFTRARVDADGFMIPGGSGMLAKKYVLYVDQLKRAQLFVGGDNELVAMTIDDVSRDVSTGIFVSQWTTTLPSGGDVFEPESWQCTETKLGDQTQELADWDLLRIFFPQSFSLEQVPRRALSV